MRQAAATTAFVALGGCLLAQADSLPPCYGVVYLDRHASPEVETAARDLADFIGRTFGQQPDIRREPLERAARGLRVGPAPDDPRFDRDPLTDEVLVARDRRGIAILGSDNTAACFAVYRFIEEFLGWRYYQPGELGIERVDSPPQPPPVQGPDEALLVERAGFLSRNLHSLGSNGGPDWSRWHGLRERLAYNHSLHDVADPALFDAHPAWFAKDSSGSPVRPPYPQPHGYNDHPDLSSAGLREWVAGRTVRALAASLPGAEPIPPGERALPRVVASPGMVSTSLSLGDSYVFGEYTDAYDWKPQAYFRRWPDWSDHVFDYTNAVADAALAQWRALPEPYGGKPRLLIGALSYLVWENTPSFAVPEHVIPYLTYDRSQWHDPAGRADDLATVERWSRNGPAFLGTWDYLFGHGFLIPRSLTGVVADSIPELHRRGVRAYFSQIGAIWPYDAHTNWLAARLLWNPQADPDSLAGEFFREFYGPAADDMRAFFGMAEDAWMGQGGHGWWLRYWKDPWQAALHGEPGLDAMQARLSAAAAKAGGRFAERVHQTADLFAVTRLFASHMEAGWRLQAVDWESAGPQQLRAGLALAAEALDLRERLTAETARVTAANPLAAPAGDLSWVFRYDCAGGSLGAILARLAGADGRGDQRARADELLARWARLEGLSGTPGTAVPRQVLHDTDFASSGDPRIWRRQFLDSEGLTAGRSASGTGFLAEEVRRGHVFQFFHAEPGSWYLGLLDVATRQSPSGEVYIRLDFYDAQNRLLAESRRARIAPTGRFGERQRLRVLMQAPAGAAFGRIIIRFYEMDPGSRADLSAVRVLDLGRRPGP